MPPELHRSTPDGEEVTALYPTTTTTTITSPSTLTFALHASTSNHKLGLLVLIGARRLRAKVTHEPPRWDESFCFVNGTQKNFPQLLEFILNVSRSAVTVSYHFLHTILTYDRTTLSVTTWGALTFLHQYTFISVFLMTWIILRIATPHLLRVRIQRLEAWPVSPWNWQSWRVT